MMMRFFPFWRRWAPQGRKARSIETVLYTRQGCCLCEQARELLLAYGFEPTLVDIDRHPDLIEAYGDCVPVVTLNGKLRFRGRVNKSLLLRLLR
jgi:glutaredoxin